MGVAGLVTAFNFVAEPHYACQRATMGYVRAHDTEWQVLTFYGTSKAGTAFEIASEKLRPETDLMAAARATAQTLLNRKESPP